MTKAKPLSPEEFATYINDPRFNRICQLSANTLQSHPEPFQISYADFGFHRENTTDDSGEDTSEELVFLYFGPLVGSRLWNVTKDGLAKKYKVRLMIPERPGIGKTDGLPAERLLEVWREAVAALLNHLEIKHVSIGCHSGGTIFALDFAVHYPQFLRPWRPYIVLAGPWVHPSHSGMLIWSFASSVPRSLVAQTDKVISFFGGTLGPAIGASSAVSASVGQLWNQTKPSGREDPDVSFEEGVRERVAERVFAGGVGGLSQEPQVLLRNGVEKDGWSDWGDIDVLAPRLSEAVKNVGGARLNVDIFFAEKDNMIGDAGGKGSKWLEACWKDVAGVEFTSQVVKGSDHDRVWDLRWDVMETVFKRMTQEAS